VKKYKKREREKLQLKDWIIYKQVAITITADLEGSIISTRLKSKGPYESQKTDNDGRK
jgi:hypothetical protein